MTPRVRSRSILLVVALVVVWLYLPPIGSSVSLPDLEPFLEPPVPHARPVFIKSGDHVYYRVRLLGLVGHGFSERYMKHLLSRGVQFDQITTSPFGPAFRVTGWKVAMARERSVTPYAIEYWKSIDYKRSDSPIKTRWPWVYVRLGFDILDPPKAVVLFPLADLRHVSDGLRRPQGAVLLGAQVDEEGVLQKGVTLEFAVPGTAEAVVRYFGDILGVDVASKIARHDYSLFVQDARELLPAGVPPPGGAQIQVRTHLFSDDPLVIYWLFAVSSG